MLVGLFLVLKYLGKEWINWFMSLYFSLAGLYSVPHVVSLLACACFLLTLRSLSLAWWHLRWALNAGANSLAIM